MAHTFETHESANEFFQKIYDESMVKVDQLFEMYQALEERYREESGFNIKARKDEERQRKEMPGVTPSPMQLPDTDREILCSAAAYGVEFTCPVQAYWRGGEMWFYVDSPFGFLEPMFLTAEGSKDIECAAQVAKECFGQKYCGAKVVPVFYTVKDCSDSFMDKFKIGAVLSVMAWPHMPDKLTEKMKGFFQLIYATARLAFEGEKPLSEDELNELETLFGK